MAGVLSAFLSLAGLVGLPAANADPVCVTVSGHVWASDLTPLADAVVWAPEGDPTDNGLLPPPLSDPTDPGNPCGAVAVRTGASGSYTLSVDAVNLPIGFNVIKTGYDTASFLYPDTTDATLYLHVTTWSDPGCEEDGNPSLSEWVCNEPQVPSDPITTVQTDCVAIFCHANLEEIALAGYDTTHLVQMNAMAESCGALRAGGPGSSGPTGMGVNCVGGVHDPTSGAGSGAYSLLGFALYRDHGTNCRGSVVLNGHCGFLEFESASYAPGTPTFTIWRARSGNNNPADDCAPNLGPINLSTNPRGYYRLGWSSSPGGLSTFTGYEARSDPMYDPGLWRLEPWSVPCPTTTHPEQERGAFELHGGTGAHAFIVTHGCIRVDAGTITQIKDKWDHDMQNKRDGGVPVSIYYQA